MNVPSILSLDSATGAGSVYADNLSLDGQYDLQVTFEATNGDGSVFTQSQQLPPLIITDPCDSTSIDSLVASNTIMENFIGVPSTL